MKVLQVEVTTCSAAARHSPMRARGALQQPGHCSKSCVCSAEKRRLNVINGISAINLVIQSMKTHYTITDTPPFASVASSHHLVIVESALCQKHWSAGSFTRLSLSKDPKRKRNRVERVFTSPV